MIRSVKFRPIIVSFSYLSENNTAPGFPQVFGDLIPWNSASLPPRFYSFGCIYSEVVNKIGSRQDHGFPPTAARLEGKLQPPGGLRRTSRENQGNRPGYSFFHDWLLLRGKVADILVVDDDRALASFLQKVIEREGHKASVAYNLEDGLDLLGQNQFQVLFLDVVLPDGNGLEALSQIREQVDPPEVIIITGHRNPEGAELAISSGAWDYVSKPFSIKELKLTLSRVIQYKSVLEESKKAKILDLTGIIGTSRPMKNCYEFVARAAKSEANVLIAGETGTGKELFSWAIHKNSSRAGNRFVIVDCAAIPETLIESILFGHVKGSFTGADSQREGLLKQADGGTLFLDEIAELPVSIQSKFLRVLESRRFRPIGSLEEVSSDFRLISATNRDLSDMVAQGAFRRDLLHRLQVLTLELPPLRDRGEDLMQLTGWYIKRYCELHQQPLKGFSPDFSAKLASYSWPGNIRELFNALESAMVKAQHSPTVFPQHLPRDILIEIVKTSVGESGSGKPHATVHIPPVKAPLAYKDFKTQALAEAEKQYLAQLLSPLQGQRHPGRLRG